MRKMRSLATPVIAVLVAVAIGACGSSSSSTSSSGSSSSSTPASSSSSGGSGTINGSGSTFAAPIYEQWSSNVKSQGLTVNYAATGSGTGVAQLQAGTVDFAGSDPAMKDSEITAAKGPVVHFPIAFGAITVSYNLSGIKTGLKLDGATIADIFLGKIKTWNDPAITALNPGMSLPSEPITVVHRSDSSGTTAEFTQFLADYSPAWASAVGTGKEVKFPTGTGGKGNSGVAAAVKQTAGSIGYVESAYALQNGFTFAAVKNKAGQYVLPTLASTSAAALGASVPVDLRFSVINSPNPAAYPIAGQTFLIVYKDMCKAGISQGTAANVKKFITYGLGAGQAVLAQLYYAKLPPPILTKATAALSTLVCNGSPLS